MRRMLVDVSSVLRRYYHAIGPEATQDDLIDQMYHVKDRFRIDQLILAFDGREAATWRREIFPGYKADREHDRDVLVCVRNFYELARRDFHCEVIPRFEADDVIATIVRMIRTQAPEDWVFIYSRDQDFHALLDARTQQLMECRKTEPALIMTEDKLFGKFGLKPTQWVEYRMLMGDHSDGIPGLEGWGPTYSTRTLKAAGTLADAVKIWDKLPAPKAQRELLRESHENGDLEILRQIVTMRTDVPVKFTLNKPAEDVNDADPKPPDDSVLRGGAG